MAEYANIDIIARRLQILIYTVYTIENELVWIGTERMQMFESGLTLIRRCSSKQLQFVDSRSRRKKGCNDGGNNRDYNCQRDEALCSLLFIRVEPWRRFVREVKENDSTKSPSPLGVWTNALSSHLSFSMCKKCIADLLIVEENY